MKKFLWVIVFALYAFPAFACEQHEAQKEFHGFACTKDCSGHKAGYEWAQEKSIQAEADCGGTSNSFREGCVAYVRELNAVAPAHPNSPAGND